MSTVLTATWRIGSVVPWRELRRSRSRPEPRHRTECRHHDATSPGTRCRGCCCRAGRRWMRQGRALGDDRRQRRERVEVIGGVEPDDAGGDQGRRQDHVGAVPRSSGRSTRIQAFDYPDNTAVTALCESLIRRSRTARSRRASALSPSARDPRTLVFKLNPAARFWDGKPVTAAEASSTASARGRPQGQPLSAWRSAA